ncbi:hypothetical protein V8C86DRAFT_2758177 [Haematococcus lacustris]
MSADSAWSVESHPAPAAPAASIVSVRQREGGAHGALCVTMPDKWTSLDITTAGQSVTVGKLVEAGLKLRTNGGPAQLGQVRATHAVIDTRVKGGSAGGVEAAGPLKGGELSGSQVHVSTGQGAVQLKRLVGQQVQVSLQADFSAGAVYGEQVDIASRGAISIGNMDCSQSGRLRSQGGDVRVGSLDGHLEVESEGGSIEVHVHNRAGTLRLASNGGAVCVAVSPDTQLQVLLTSCGDMTLGEGCAPSSSTPPVSWLIAPSSASAAKRSGPVACGALEIAAGTGHVTMYLEGWAAAMQRKLGKA